MDDLRGPYVDLGDGALHIPYPSLKERRDTFCEKVIPGDTRLVGTPRSDTSTICDACARARVAFDRHRV